MVDHLCLQRQQYQPPQVPPQQQGYSTQTMTRQYVTPGQVDGGMMTAPQQGYNRTLTRQNSAPLIDSRTLPVQVTVQIAVKGGVSLGCSDSVFRM